MAKLEITIDGTSYPCHPTMGAMLLFKQETGHDITKVDGSDMCELFTYLYCCVKSASRRDGIPFNLTLEEFADNTSPEDLMAWAQAINSATPPAHDDDGSKKKLE